MNQAIQMEAAGRAVGRCKSSEFTEPAPPIEPLLSIEDLAAVLNVSRRVVERMRSAGRLPKADLTLGTRIPRWQAATIRAWIAGGGEGVR